MNKNLLLILILLLAAIGVLGYLKYYQNAEVATDYPFTNPELTGRYEDEELNFFLDYPEGFIVNTTVEESVKVLVFSKRDSQESFQIFIMPYDEPGPIIPERILIDQPDIVMKDPQTVEIAGEEALVFFS